MKERNGKMSFDHIAEKWAEALNAIYNEKLSWKELHSFLSEMNIPYYIQLMTWIRGRGFSSRTGEGNIKVYRVTDRVTKEEILPDVKQIALRHRARVRISSKTRRSAEQKRGAGIKMSDIEQATPDLSGTIHYSSGNIHLSNNSLNLADATDSQLVDELRKRGFEVIAKKVTVVEL